MVSNYQDLYELIRIEIKQTFAVGSSYSRSRVKEILGEIYHNYDIKRSPSHSDLKDILMIKEKKVKGERFIEIIGKLK
jgi:hypothetical protein